MEAIDLGFADVVIYDNYINVLGLMGDISQAESFFLERINLQNYLTGGADQVLIFDFHDFGFVSAYIAFNHIMAEATQGKEITLILGRGSHSEREHVLRRVADLFFEQHPEIQVASLNRVDITGRITVTLNGTYNEGLIRNTRFLYTALPAQGVSRWNIDVQQEQSSSPVVTERDATVVAEDEAHDENRGDVTQKRIKRKSKKRRGKERAAAAAGNAEASSSTSPPAVLALRIIPPANIEGVAVEEPITPSLTRRLWGAVRRAANRVGIVAVALAVPSS
jgi:hypothetical protein